MRAAGGEADRERAAAALVARLGAAVEPAVLDLDLIALALVHRSWSFEHGGVATNERLEFLGDSVLQLVVTEELYRRHPDLPEGRLAQARAAVVSTRALAGVAVDLDLGRCVRLGRGEEGTGGRHKASILADTTEAVLGATYLSVGPDATRAALLPLLAPLMERALTLEAGLDWKTSLQELLARRGLGAPLYRVDHSGPDHARVFTAEVVAGPVVDGAGDDEGGGDADGRGDGGQVLGTGSGASRKHAEQAAAEAAHQALTGGEGDDAGAAGAGAGTGPAGA